jgi:hypothetical protein
VGACPRRRGPGVPSRDRHPRHTGASSRAIKRFQALPRLTANMCQRCPWRGAARATVPPLYVERTLPRVELPRYQTEVAAGFDLAMWGWYVEGEEEPIARAFYLPPGRSIKVRTGSATTCGSRAATGTGRRPGTWGARPGPGAPARPVSTSTPTRPPVAVGSTTSRRGRHRGRPNSSVGWGREPGGTSPPPAPGFGRGPPTGPFPRGRRAPSGATGSAGRTPDAMRPGGRVPPGTLPRSSAGGDRRHPTRVDRIVGGDDAPAARGLGRMLSARGSCRGGRTALTFGEDGRWWMTSPSVVPSPRSRTQVVTTGVDGPTPAAASRQEAAISPPRRRHDPRRPGRAVDLPRTRTTPMGACATTPRHPTSPRKTTMGAVSRWG